MAPQDPSYKEYLLSYYGIPDKLLSREEAIEVAIVTEFERKDIILSIYNNTNLIYNNKSYDTVYQMCHYLDQRYENS